MPLSPNNSLPRVIAFGIDDQSEELLPIEVESIPVHLPICPILAPWGPTEPILTGSAGAQRIFGREIFDVLTPYYTHQNVLAQQVSGEGNLVYWLRMLAENADYARLRISLDLVAEPEKPTYQRNEDGTFRRDQSTGELVPTGDTIAGFIGRWMIQPIDVIDDELTFGLASQTEGNLVNSLGENSTIYPMMDLEVRWQGGRGNNLGIRISAPTVRSSNPANSTSVKDMSAFVYRFSAITRDNPNSSATVINTRTGGQYVEATLAQGTIDSSRTSMSFEDRFLLGYESDNPDEFTGYGPFKRVHVYNNELDTVLEAIYAEEEAYDTIPSDVSDPKHLINPFTAVSVDGVPLYTLELRGPADGGILFTENTNHWAVGGTDGDVDIDTYEEGVGRFADKFLDIESCEYSDMLQYPFSFFWDSGYKGAIKDKLPAIMNRRNTIVATATQVAGAPLNTGDQESSAAVNLRALLRAFPESDQYGTSTCRGLVVGNGGRYIPSAYRGNLPFTIELARRCAAYMGAASGVFNTSQAIDVDPNKIVSNYRNHNAGFKPVTARGTDWNNGLIFAQPYDTRRQMWAGLRTVYDNPTSVLVSFLNVVILCRATFVAHQAWRTYVGNGLLSDLQYVERVDDFIRENCPPSNFDNRMTIDPLSSYSLEDQARNFSYTTVLRGGGRGLKTVQNLTIVAERQAVTTQAQEA